MFNESNIVLRAFSQTYRKCTHFSSSADGSRYGENSMMTLVEGFHIGLPFLVNDFCLNFRYILV